MLLHKALLGMALHLPSQTVPEQQTVLPGLLPSGEIQLPNQWKLNPVGSHLGLGDFPVQIALHQDAKFAAILHTGYGEHEVVVASLSGGPPKVVSRVSLPQSFHGMSFSRDGKTLWVSGAERETVLGYPFDNGYLGKPKVVQVVDVKETFIPAGIAEMPKGGMLAVCGLLGNEVALVDPSGAKAPVRVKTGDQTLPYAALPLDEDTVLVSLWGKSSIAKIDLDDGKIEAVWELGHSHPTEMNLHPDGKTLYVSCANSTKVVVVDLETGKAIQTINCALHPGSPNGNTPSSLSMSQDGALLAVANADANNVALFSITDRASAKSLGFIPAGWYPTSVRFTPSGQVLIANGKGLTSKANPGGPNPAPRDTKLPIRQYIAGLFPGSLQVVPRPEPALMEEWTRKAYAASPLKADFQPVLSRPEGNPVPAKIGEPSPIRHCVYIIKENRTYDQVFGDMPEGNGEKSLCLFPEKITPNHHKLARDYVLLDNTYVEGEVSADGHEWTMAAYATDFVEKAWPQSYRGSPLKKFGFYPAEGNKDPIARPAGGYLWDRAAEAGVTYRSYGEWIGDGDAPGGPSKAKVKALEGHFDPYYPNYNLDITDVTRANRFLKELAEFEQKGEYPQLTIVRLPNDHTAGTRPGSITPTSMVADNDMALGMVIEGLSKSKFWKEMAVFVIQDDVQNGPDHVDAHRSVALCVSPFTKGRGRDSTMYSTSSMLRTMELILGLKPMSQFDAAARPMYAAFKNTPDATPYTALKPGVDLNEKNKSTAWGAKKSMTLNLAVEDAADDLVFNEIIWKSVKGANSPLPAPVRGAFFLRK
ncbi:MAG: hypothetical protein DWH88_00540 [Planctomycetota bacterium]|nr:MAG: hypothetical protein DWH88_00540 [Planctomycetota bacterium]